MNIISKDIYYLINSLSKTEKRYIKIHLSNKGKDKLKLKLFDEICRKKQALITDFENKFVWTKNLGKLKYDLYVTILKQLEIYLSNNNEFIRLRRRLNQIQILYNRKLFKQCQKLIKQTLKKAYLLEEFNIVVELNILLLKTLTYSELSRTDEHDIVLSSINEATNKMDIDNRFKKINALFFSLVKTWGTSNTINKQITKLINNPIFTKENSLNSFTSAYLYNNMLVIYYQHYNNSKRAYLHSKANINLFLNNKKNIDYHKSKYISCVNNHIVSCMQQYNEQELEETCQLLLEVPVKTELEVIEKYQYYSTNRIASLIVLGKIDEALKLENYIISGQLKYKNRISPLFKMTINFNLASILFLSGQLKKSLKYVNLIIQEKTNTIRKDGLTMATILNLLIHYELKNDNLANSLFLSYTRTLIKKKKSTIEHWFIEFYQLLLNKTTISKNFYKVQEEKLLSNIHPKDKSLAELMDLFVWLRVKHDKINIPNALIDYYKLDFKTYQKNRLKDLSKL